MAQESPQYTHPSWKSAWTPGEDGLDKNEIYLFRRRKAERYVLCRGGHAKASLLELDSGQILAAIGLHHYAEGAFDKDNRPWPTQIGMLRSNDGGRTWSEPREIINQDWTTDREPCLVQLPDGTLVMTWHGFYAESGKMIGNGFISRSTDNGETWDPPQVMSHPSTGQRMIGGRNSAVLPDGRLLVLVGVWTDSSTSDCYVASSRDAGRTFEELRLVARSCDDSNVVVLPSGKIVCSLRMAPVWGAEKPYPITPDLDGFEALDYMATSESTDGGTTWSDLRPATGYGEVPASLTPLQNGRLLLTHGIRHYPLGVQAKISSDDGATWADEALMLCWFGPIKWECDDDSYIGHPCTIQRRDGRMLTSYNRWESPLGYSHFEEIVIWDLP